MKDEKQIRVLHVLGTLDVGGAESRIMDLYRHIDRERVQFDFLIHTGAEPSDGRDYSSDALMKARTPQAFDDEVIRLGGHIYALPRPDLKHLRKYRRAVDRFFSEHHSYAAVEGHMTSTASIYLPAAKKAGVPVTLAHVRSGGSGTGLKKIMTDLMRSDLPSKADRLLSCTMEAGIHVYGKRAKDRIEIIPNAIETERLKFDKTARGRYRSELGIPEDAFVIGHVGRFDPMKNQAFLIRLAGKIAEQGSDGQDICLVFVGDGSLRKECEDLSAQLGIADRVRFTGVCSRDKTAGLYQAFDLFALPSFYEGMPGTAIEAQSSGLGCLLSDAITAEAELTPLVRRISLDDPGLWEETIRKIMREQARTDEARIMRSEEALQKLDEAGYNVETLAVRMAQYYEECR
ncbi:MAG: glycosyltransferase [Lachnospiraceae bacterium]|nr:glycosyltransferase [Lachnospiraceae bacterium]